jgi:hypothetical protein
MELEPAKFVLRSFLSEINQVKLIRNNISAPILTAFNITDQIPDLSDIDFVPAPDSLWIKEDAYIKNLLNVA